MVPAGMKGKAGSVRRRALVGIAALVLPGCQSPATTTTATMPDGAVPIATTATSAAAPEAGPDAAGAPPLSARRAGQLAATLHDFLDYSPRAVYPVDKLKEVDDTFLVVAGEDSAPLDQAADVVHATAQAMWSGPMVHRPDLAIRIWLFATRKKYEAFRSEYGPKDSRRSDLSFWDPNTRSIFYCVEGQGITGLQHEVLHPLEIEDFPRSPYWLQEALPALMEAGSFVDGQLVAKPHFRLVTLRTALTKPEYAPKVRLDRLFELTTYDKFMSESVELHYAAGREALRWLLTAKHALWNFYASCRQGVLTDPTCEQAFTSAVGASPEAATAEWIAWLQSPEAEK